MRVLRHHKADNLGISIVASGFVGFVWGCAESSNSIYKQCNEPTTISMTLSGSHIPVAKSLTRV